MRKGHKFCATDFSWYSFKKKKTWAVFVIVRLKETYKLLLTWNVQKEIRNAIDMWCKCALRKFYHLQGKTLSYLLSSENLMRVFVVPIIRLFKCKFGIQSFENCSCKALIRPRTPINIAIEKTNKFILSVEPKALIFTSM